MTMVTRNLYQEGNLGPVREGVTVRTGRNPTTNPDPDIWALN